VIDAFVLRFMVDCFGEPHTKFDYLLHELVSAECHNDTVGDDLL
jgi:hypothetical protein